MTWFLIEILFLDSGEVILLVICAREVIDYIYTTNTL